MDDLRHFPHAPRDERAFGRNDSGFGPRDGGDEERGRERDRYNEAIVTSGEVEFATLFASNLQWEVSRILCMVTVLVLRHYMRILDWDCVQGRGYCDCHRIHLESYPSISRLSVCTLKSGTFVNEILRFFS